MKTKAYIYCVLLSTLFATSVVSSPFRSAQASAAKGVELDTSKTTAQPLVTRDGSKLLGDMTERIKELGAYQFDGLLGTMKDRKNELSVNSGVFYYKPKALLRVEVRGNGFKAGSILVKQKDGVIIAKGGPALLGMKMSLEPDSNMLRLPNGLNIIDCDYLSLLKWLQSQIASGQKVYASESPLVVGTQTQRVMVLETREAGQADSMVAHRILLDPQLLVPIEWDLFKQGKFFSTVRFQNFKVNPNMDESLFRL